MVRFLLWETLKYLYQKVFFYLGFFNFPREEPNNQSWLHNLQGLVYNENPGPLVQKSGKSSVRGTKTNIFSLEIFYYLEHRGNIDIYIMLNLLTYKLQKITFLISFYTIQ